MKKLIPALILLLVSAMVLSTSSYAWFSMNRTVSATGMSLTSTAPANLLITNAAGNVGDTFADTVWKSSIAASETYLGKLYPSSTNNAVTFHAIKDGQTMGDNNIGGIAVTDKTIFMKDSDVTKLTADSKSDGYWAEYTLYMKTTGESNLSVYLDSINIATEATYKDVTDAMKINASVVGYYTTNTDSGTPATGYFNDSDTYYSRTGNEAPYTFTEVTLELAEKASVIGLYTTTTGTAATGVYSDGTTYYQKLDVSYTEVIGLTAGASLAGYYTVNAGVYTKCADTDTYSSGTYYKPVSIYNCVRVAIFSDEGTGEMGTNAIAIYAIDQGTTVTPITTVTYTGEVFTSFTAAGEDVKTAQGTKTSDITVLANGVVTKLLVKVWIEGQHSGCVNAVAGQNFNIGLAFKTETVNS